MHPRPERPPEERTLRIESLVHGGDGLARDDGEVVFVPLTAPGDLVRVALEPRVGGVRHARLLEVLEPGPQRIAPPCPLVGTCGGCQWQQVSPGGQGSAKAATVVEALRRVGRLDPPVRELARSPKPERYRRRLRAHPVKDGWGFALRGSVKVVPVPTCLLVEEPVERLATEVVRAWREARLPRISSFSVDALEAGGGAAHLEFVEPVTPLVKAATGRLLSLAKGLRGVVLTGPNGAPQTVGDPVLVDEGHRRLRVRPDLFAQANRLGARLLAAAVAETVAPGSKVLELYCGAGTLTLFLAERAAELVASEGEGPSLELLRLALAEHGRSARLLPGPARKVSESLANSGDRFDHVVLDPPRAGAKEVLPALVRLAPERITYVSCDPATFARDAAALVAAGWRLEEVVPWDLFPHTFHVEVVGTFRRA